jgi:diamine N-acetyltransferase
MIKLQPVSAENWRTLIQLKVREDQSHFVASNLHSIAESQFGFDDEGHWNSYPFGIYHNEEPVGFLMYAANPTHSKIQVFVMRLMVDKKFQGQGFGRRALELALEKFRADQEFRVVAISYAPDNVGAKKLYANLGFEETGEMAGEEFLAVLNLR